MKWTLGGVIAVLVAFSFIEGRSPSGSSGWYAAAGANIILLVLIVAWIVRAAYRVRRGPGLGPHGNRAEHRWTGTFKNRSRLFWLAMVLFLVGCAAFVVDVAERYYGIGDVPTPPPGMVYTCVMPANLPLASGTVNGATCKAQGGTVELVPAR